MKMSNCVKIKMNEKVMRLRSLTLTVGNLAMIFKLDINRGIYIWCEEEGEIIIPTETGFFNIEDYGKTYVVNGKPTRPASSRTSDELSLPCNLLGIPLSYQRTASLRTNLNSPPGQMPSTQTLQRPSFSSSSGKVQPSSWKKSVVVVDVLSSGAINKKFQVHLTLAEETVSVDEVQKMLKEQLGFDVILLNAKHLPVMSIKQAKQRNLEKR